MKAKPAPEALPRIARRALVRAKLANLRAKLAASIAEGGSHSLDDTLAFLAAERARR
jgi:hypothetical protein